MKSMKAKLITAILIASLALSAKAQTTDDGVIQTSDNPPEWTTGQIQTPMINWFYNGLPLSIFYNDANNTTANGYWQNYNTSGLDGFNPFVSGNGTGSDPLSGISEQPIKINYMLADSANARHGVGGKIDRKVDRYEVECTIAYTDTATNQPTSVTFTIPNHLAKYIMDWDTTGNIPFNPGFSYTTAANPEKVDSILNNIYNVQVNPDFAQNKRNQEEMNETSPYTGTGAATNTTLENISEGGVGNPWNPEIFSMFMEDHSKKKSSYSTPENTEGPKPDVDEGDLETMVLKTANGNVTVRYLMPDTTKTHPGAEVINIYEIEVDSGFMPDLQVYGLPATITMDQLNDTIFDVAVAMQTPEGSKSATYDVSVDFDAIPVSTPEIPEIPAKPDYDATNFPNPFLDNTTLSYTLKNKGMVEIALYDMNGKVVENVFKGQQVAGNHEFSINGSNYSSGMYFLNIAGGEGVQTLKFLKQ